MKNTPHHNSFLRYLPEMLVFILIVSIPELFAFIVTPEGKSFTGALVNPDDLNTYLAAIRQGAQGAWLFTPPFSPEPIPSHLAYLPYLLIGHVLGFFHLKVYYAGYQILRLFSLIFSFYAFDKLIKTLFPANREIQQKIFRVLLFAGGAGWLVAGFLGLSSPYTPDLTTPEWNLLLSFFANPHFLLGIGFESMLVREFVLSADKMDWKSSLMIAVWGTGLGLTYPFLVLVVGLIIGIRIIHLAIASRRIPTNYLLKAFIGSLPMVGLLIYYGIILPQDQWYLQTMLQNNAIKPPHPIGLLIGFSFLIIPAIFGLSGWIRSQNPIVIPFWVLANVVALYLPFTFAGRFLAGLFIPLSILGVFGFQEISSHYPSPNKRFPLYFLLLLPGNILILLFLLQTPQTTRDFPLYIPKTEIQALQWLGENTTSSDLVLAEYPIGSIAPRYIPAKVFIGHLNLTIDLNGKRNQVLEFWSEQITSKERVQFINDWAITYIYQGMYEKNISGEEIIPPGELVYENEDVSIYTEFPIP